MKKIEVIQPSKMVSAYGGVGSIIETLSNGSLLLTPYNKWGKGVKEGEEIVDNRLLKHIQEQVESVKTIRRIPAVSLNDAELYSPKKDTRDKCIQSKYFPEWFYCNRCHRLNKYDEWKKLWNKKFKFEFSDNMPACPCCSEQRGRGVHRKYLEQIRYVMVSLNGNLIDIPFHELVYCRENNPQEEWGKKIKLSEAVSIRELKWKFTPNTNGEDFINVIAEGKGGDNLYLPMTLLQENYIEYKGDVYKIVMRNQNNLYYPERISSIYIPELFKGDIVDNILAAKENGQTIDDIIRNISCFLNIELEEEDINYTLENRELPFTNQEFLFITNEKFYSKGSYHHIKEDSYFSACWCKNMMSIPFVSKVYAIERLKETSVVLEYTRLTPSGKGIRWWSLKEDGEVDNLLATSRRTYDGATPEFIPGVERYGEGIFFELDTEQIRAQIGDDTDKFRTFIHTFSHIIMRELEFSSGYTLASLVERLYILDNQRAGILIYTVAASYGGFAGLCAEGAIVDIVKRAIARIQVCVNDPICEDHCYACLDIPEISCCDWNKDLNRNLLQMPLSD